MPSFRKLSVAETAALEHHSPSVRAQVAREYDAYLDGFAIGDYGRAELVDGERRALVRQRLQAAARRRDLTLRFRPGPGAALIFHVEAARPAVVRPILTPAADVDQPRDGTARRDQAPARPPRRRQTSAERYHEMLPRWMRTGDTAGMRSGWRRNDRKRRPR
jgi:hypothetical protein